MISFNLKTAKEGFVSFCELSWSARHSIWQQYKLRKLRSCQKLKVFCEFF